MKQLSGAIRNYLFLLIPFFLLLAILPANKAVMGRYSVSASQYHVLLFLVEAPLVFIWLAAFYGYAKLKQYAHAIAATPEADGYQQLANGYTWLAWGLPIPTLLGLIVNGIANRHPDFHANAIVFTNYIALFFAIVAFTIISDASRQLVGRAKLKIGFADARLLQLFFVAIGVLYCYLTLRHLDLNSLNSTNNPYHLPVWLFVATIVIPYLYAWFVGLLAAYNFSLLARHSPGVLYRQALRLMASGLVVVIASLITSQYVRTAVPRTGHLSLNGTLITLYAIYACTVAGFILIAFGVNKLKKIEEV